MDLDGIKALTRLRHKQGPRLLCVISENASDVHRLGCNLNVISVQNKRPKEGEEESEAQDGEMTWEQALYHVGWWTGLNHVKWCEMIDPHPSAAGKEHLLPRTPTHCRQNDALQGAMMSARMLPLRDPQMQFMSHGRWSRVPRVRSFWFFTTKSTTQILKTKH